MNPAAIGPAKENAKAERYQFQKVLS